MEIYKQYSNPEATKWLGWIENSWGQCVAFVKLDGEIVRG